MERKLIAGITLVTLAAAIIGSGILYAYFSDTQTTGGNIFTTGELLLQVGTTAPCVESITISDMKPGDFGSVADWQLQSIGTINGKLDIVINAIGNQENTNNRAEVAAGDSTTPDGELGANLMMAFWMDVDNSNSWTSGDYYLKSDGTKVSFQPGDSGLPSAAFDILDNYSGDIFENLQENITPGTTFGYFQVEYKLPEATGNAVQTDSSTFTISFTLKQNNAA